MPSERTGPGFGPGNGTSPEQIAAALEKARRMNKLGANRMKHVIKTAEEAAGMGIDELRKKMSTRDLTIAMLHCGGLNNAQIATAMGYSSRGTLMDALKRPGVARLIDLIKQEQIRRVVDGEFGVAAAAKAAAPRIMKNVIEKAGGLGDGSGVAAKDADMLRAADLALTISGDKVERTQSVSVRLTEKMTLAECEAFATTGKLPAHLAHLTDPLGLEGPEPPIDVTP